MANKTHNRSATLDLQQLARTHQTLQPHPMATYTFTLPRILLCLQIVKLTLSIFAFFMPPYALYFKGAEIVLSTAVWFLERRIKK